MTGRKRAVLQTGNHYTTAFKLVFVVPIIIILIVPVYICLWLEYMWWSHNIRDALFREDPLLFSSHTWWEKEKVVEFDFSGERPMPDYLDIRVDPINQVSADLMFYWIGVYMLMAPY